jgi:hypothetical protein
MDDSKELGAVAISDKDIRDQAFALKNQQNLAAFMTDHLDTQEDRKKAENEQARRNNYTIDLNGPDFMDKKAAAIYDSDLPIICLFSVADSDEVWGVFRPLEGKHKRISGDVQFSVVKLVRRDEENHPSRFGQGNSRHVRPLHYIPTAQDEATNVIPPLRVNPYTKRLLQKGESDMRVILDYPENKGLKGIGVDLHVDQSDNSLNLSADGKTTLYVYANQQARKDTVPEPES